MQGEHQVGKVYSREELLLIGKSVLTLDKTLRVPAESWRNIQNLGLGTALKTRRGKKEPKKKQLNNTSDLQVTYINARSVNNKVDDINEHIKDQKADICCISETWIKAGREENATLGALTPEGYQLFHVPRVGKRGGGVAIICRSELDISEQPRDKFNTFEHIEVLLKSHTRCIRLVVLYRPPSGSPQEFLNELLQYVDGHSTTTGHLLLVGDLNFHFESQTDPNAAKLKDLLYSLNLKQSVKEPTHERGHTLDLVITRQEELDVYELTVTPNTLFDHSTIEFKLPFSKPDLPIKTIKYRKTKDIDIESFTQDIEESKLIQNPPSDLEQLVSTYQSTLSEIFDKHAPEIEKNFKLRPDSPWYNEEIRKAKRERRKAERKYRKKKETGYREALKAKQREVNKLCHEAKKEYYNRKISEGEENSKDLFKVTNTLLHKENSGALPTHSSEKELTNDIGTFFKQKIINLREQFPAKVRYQSTSSAVSTIGDCILQSFKDITETDVSKVIKEGNSKSCALDPIPTSLVKKTLPVLLPVIHSIVNKSLQESTMPSLLKRALVKPLIKKPSLDKENLKNYRPVSNLPYIGKLIEKAAIKQINEHLTENNLHEPLQSAYTTNHSTETALLKVTNDIFMALDKRHCVFLVLLDLSAAFDTIDHDMFLQRLATEYAITGEVVTWMRSYLVNREQNISINNTLSDKITLDFGFPQGSCIGPFGFKLYTKPLTSIAKKHNVNIHLYADDTQLYVPFDPCNSGECVEAMKRLECCIEEIRVWMTENYLCLNDGKTEFLILGGKADLEKVNINHVTVGNSKIEANDTARNIGAHFDSTMDMKPHVNRVIRACYHQIRLIAKIRKYLSMDSASKLIHAFVTSRLDNLNSLLVELPDYVLNKLQLVQNNAARLVAREKKSSHVTPLLKQLHWLPIEYRIKYKIVLIVYKCLHEMGPVYLTSLLTGYHPGTSMCLRSDKEELLDNKRTAKGYGDRAFAKSGPELWNALPLNIRNSSSVTAFKSSIKTHYYKICYV